MLRFGAFRSPIEEDLDKRRMTIQRRRGDNLYPVVFAGDISQEARQIPLQVQTQREEIGDHHDAANVAGGHGTYRLVQVRLSEFQKGRQNVGKPAGSGKPAGHGTHRLIGRLNAGTVSEDDESGRQDP